MIGNISRTLVQGEKSANEFNRFADEMALKFTNLEPILEVMADNLRLCYGVPTESEEEYAFIQPMAEETRQ